MTKLADTYPDFANIARLSIGVFAYHPLTKASLRYRRSYLKNDRTYFIEGPIDYVRLALPDWGARTDALADTVKECLVRVAQSRLTKEERTRLQVLAEQAKSQIRESPPQEIKPVSSIFLIYGAPGKRPVISFAPVNSVIVGSGRVVEVRPEEAATIAKAESTPKRVPLRLFKLYRRIDGRLHYREAWAREKEVFEHWGECGTRGQVRHHPILDDSQAQKLLRNLQKEARLADYRPIPPSRHQTLVVEYQIDGFGDAKDLTFRHAAEDLLDNHLGWLGLGHCDGGSTGGNTMEVFCKVADFDAAKAALERDLSGNRFGQFSRIYHLR
ncbi:MAG: hypothetical protein WBX25_01140 [Rhodomicrobium sp.]